MATVASDPSYSNVANGYYYALVNVTNSYGVTAMYRVYRTYNSLGGSINILIS
jgi:hypothetical protein